MYLAFMASECILGAGLVMLLIASSCFEFINRHIVGFVFTLLLLSIAFLCYFSFPVESTVQWSGLFIQDYLAYSVKLLLLLGMLVIVGISSRQSKDFYFPRKEFYILLCLQLLGMMVTVSSANWISLFVGIELMYLPIYAMVVMRREDVLAHEAGIKYIVLGMLASCLLLYGISLLYVVVGDLSFTKMFQKIESLDVAHSHFSSLSGDKMLILVSIATVFILVALLFKFGVFALHLWVPDVYMASTYTVVSLISSLPKLVLFVIWFRVFGSSGVLSSMVGIWQYPVLAIAILSVVYGNFLGIVQKNIKRMLAYSSIAHMGYMLLALGIATQEGLLAAFIYVLGYVFSVLFTFACLSQMRFSGQELVNIDDLKGMLYVYPVQSLVLIIAMFSMLGMPPFLGFMLKMQLMIALMREHFYMLAVTGVLAGVVGAYYYLNIVSALCFVPSKSEARNIKENTSGFLSQTILFASVFILVLGIGFNEVVLYAQHVISAV